MKFNYSKENLKPKEARLQRSLEILPGASSWSVLLGLIFLSIFFPLIAAILIVAFYLSWIMRVLYSTFFLVLSYLHMNIESKTDWMRRIQSIDDLQCLFKKKINARKFGRHWRQRISHKRHPSGSIIQTPSQQNYATRVQRYLSSSDLPRHQRRP